MSSLSDKKSVYHSTLVKAGQIVVTITSNHPMDSKYPNRPQYIPFKFEAEEHFYEGENPDCLAALSGLQGQTVMIEATGSRSDAAITVYDAPAGAASHQQPAAPPKGRDVAPRGSLPVRPPAQQQPAARPPVQQPPGGAAGADRAHAEAKAFKSAKRTAAQVGVLWRLAIKSAESAMGSETCTEGMSGEDFRAVLITTFIELKGRIDINALPVRFPEAAAEPPPQRQPQRQPEPPPRELEPEPDPLDAPEDDIPF